jgi:hypothetical protein
MRSGPALAIACQVSVRLRPGGPTGWSLLEATESELADDGRAARLDELQACADQAARRIDAQRAELDANSLVPASPGLMPYAALLRTALVVPDDWRSEIP